MSPEQARGGDVDSRSDIYSLGVLAYFGLARKPPYDGADGFAVAYAHVFEPIPRVPESSAHWQPLIDRALAKDPKDRYADIEQFLNEMAGVVPQYAALFREDAAPVGTPAPAVSSSPTAADPATRVMQRTTLPESKTSVPTPKPAPAHAPVLQKSAPTASAVAPAAFNWTRAWPVLILLAGVGLIGFALISRNQRPALPIAPVPTATAPTAPPIAPAVVATPEPTSAPASAPMTIVESPTAPATPAPSLSAMDMVDANEAQAGGVLSADLANQISTVVDPLEDAIRSGRAALAAQRLTSPPGDNAFERFRLALRIEPRNKQAKQGIADIAKKYVEYAEKNLAGGDTAQFEQYLKRALDVDKVVADDVETPRLVTAARAKAAAPYLEKAKVAAATWDKVGAKAAYDKALQLDPENAQAREGIKFAATIGEPGFQFRDKLVDGAQGPELVVLDNRIAVARHEVTRAEFRRFWNAAGHALGKEPDCGDREKIFGGSGGRSWQKPGIEGSEWGDDQPVVCVSIAQAIAYAQWLGHETGKHYRLPTSGEFDRAHAATGKVRVWVDSCDIGAKAAEGCGKNIARGRSWASKDATDTNDFRGNNAAQNTVGFRVVRDLGSP
jgi:serine/threonine-protein kinase PpkA